MHQFHCAYSIYTTTDKGELVCMDLSNGNRHSEKACGSKNVFTPIGQATNNATEGQSGSYRYELSSCMKEKATLTTNTYIVHTGIQVCVCVYTPFNPCVVGGLHSGLSAGGSVDKGSMSELFSALQGTHPSSMTPTVPHLNLSRPGTALLPMSASTHGRPTNGVM